MMYRFFLVYLRVLFSRLFLIDICDLEVVFWSSMQMICYFINQLGHLGLGPFN